MNLLVIGNGFDLAHGFQTRYTDFLKYCKEYRNCNPISNVEDMNQNSRILLQIIYGLNIFINNKFRR